MLLYTACSMLAISVHNLKCIHVIGVMTIYITHALPAITLRLGLAPLSVLQLL